MQCCQKISATSREKFLGNAKNQNRSCWVSLTTFVLCSPQLINTFKFRVLGFEPSTEGWVARTQPLCHDLDIKHLNDVTTWPFLGMALEACFLFPEKKSSSKAEKIWTLVDGLARVWSDWFTAAAAASAQTPATNFFQIIWFPIFFPNPNSGSINSWRKKGSTQAFCRSSVAQSVERPLKGPPIEVQLSDVSSNPACGIRKRS